MGGGDEGAPASSCAAARRFSTKKRIKHSTASIIGSIGASSGLDGGGEEAVPIRGEVFSAVAILRHHQSIISFGKENNSK